MSVYGYTKECVDALVFGKSPNVLLLGGEDIALAVSEVGAFSRLLKLRLREAAETGSVYRSVTPADLQPEAYAAPEEAEEALHELITRDTEPSGQLVIVCEGHFDSLIVHRLADRILKENGLIAQIKVLRAGGKQNLPRVANLFAATSTSATVVVVADTDGDIEATQRLIREGLTYDRFCLITPDPSIESWLFKGDKMAAAAARAPQPVDRVRRSFKKAEEQLDALDLVKLRSADDQFARFWEAVQEAGKIPNKADSGDGK